MTLGDLLHAYGLPVDRIATLLACKPEAGISPPKPTEPISARERNRLAQAKWRAAHPELHRQRVKESMRRLRAKRRAAKMKGGQS